MDIVIKDVCLLPMDGRNKLLENMNIYIEGNKIREISPEYKDYPSCKIIDGRNKLAMPGLINAHTHVAMSIFRNYADDLPLHSWLEDEIWPKEAKLTADHVYWSSLLSMAEMIESGTTSFSDMYFFMDEVGEALKKSGMRGVLARGMTDDNDEALNREKFEDVERLYKTWNGQLDGRVKVMVGPHAPYTCSPEFLRQSKELAKKLDTSIHIHLSETEKEVFDSFDNYEKSPIEHVRDLGLFEQPVLAAHCVYLDENDLEIIRDNDVVPVYNPGSNLKLASGFARVDEMMEMGIHVALGTDGASSNNNLNMFEEINLAALLSKAVSKDATAVSAYDALEMATINGAKALKWQDEIGSIEEGKKADIILIDMDKAHLYPRHNIISALAYSAQGSDVDTSIIDGRIVMENRQLKTLDMEEIKREIERVEEELFNR